MVLGYITIFGSFTPEEYGISIFNKLSRNFMCMLKLRTAHTGVINMS